MKIYDWSDEKNEKLKRERSVSFENVVWAIENGYLLAVIDSPNQEKYSGQHSFVINLNDYAYLVPFAAKGEIIFLKTIIPSRKATRKYLEGNNND
jgi:uncharacterized DUF497 family protein